MKHQPLEWIKKNCIFLPVSGPALAGKPVGDFILKFQEKIITSALNPDGSPNKNIFINGARKVSKKPDLQLDFNLFA